MLRSCADPTQLAISAASSQVRRSRTASSQPPAHVDDEHEAAAMDRVGSSEDASRARGARGVRRPPAPTPPPKTRTAVSKAVSGAADSKAASPMRGRRAGSPSPMHWSAARQGRRASDGGDGGDGGEAMCALCGAKRTRCR